MDTDGMRVTTNTVTIDVVHLIASFGVLGRSIAAFFVRQKIDAHQGFG